MKVGSISRNGLAALGQAVIVSLCLFLVYRIIVAQVGLEQLGIWSLLLAGSAIARVGDVSGASSLGRFLALASSDEAVETVHTVMLTTALLNIGVGSLIWIAAPMLLPLFLDEISIADARLLVPFAIGTLVLGAISGGIASGIDGLQRADLRAVIMIGGALILLMVSWYLIPRIGMIGFGYAQIGSQIFVAVIGWLVLRKHIASLGWIPTQWRREVFKDTTGYAVKLSGIGILVIFFEPLAKFAFNESGGLTQVARYELASRLITQIRSLIISAANPLVPAFAALQKEDATATSALLIRVTRLVSLSAVAMAAAVSILAFPVSYLVLGFVSKELLFVTIPLTFGWAVHLPCVPYYFAAQATGVLKWNALSHAILGLFVLAGVYGLVPFMGTAGLILSIVIGLLSAMGIVLWGNAHSLRQHDALHKTLTDMVGITIAIGAICCLAWIAATFNTTQT